MAPRATASPPAWASDRSQRCETSGARVRWQDRACTFEPGREGQDEYGIGRQVEEPGLDRGGIGREVEESVKPAGPLNPSSGCPDRSKRATPYPPRLQASPGARARVRPAPKVTMYDPPASPVGRRLPGSSAPKVPEAVYSRPARRRPGDGEGQRADGPARAMTHLSSPPINGRGGHHTRTPASRDDGFVDEWARRAGGSGAFTESLVRHTWRPEPDPPDRAGGGSRVAPPTRRNTWRGCAASPIMALSGRRLMRDVALPSSCDDQRSTSGPPRADPSRPR